MFLFLIGEKIQPNRTKNRNIIITNGVSSLARPDADSRSTMRLFEVSDDDKMLCADKESVYTIRKGKKRQIALQGFDII